MTSIGAPGTVHHSLRCVVMMGFLGDNQRADTPSVKFDANVSPVLFELIRSHDQFLYPPRIRACDLRLTASNSYTEPIEAAFLLRGKQAPAGLS